MTKQDKLLLLIRQVMVTPKRLTRKCTECRDGMMEGELQAIPNEMPLSSYQKIVPADYMPEIMKKHRFYKIFICNNCGYLKIFFA
jgi:hypothetical protein